MMDSKLKREAFYHREGEATDSMPWILLYSCALR